MAQYASLAAQFYDLYQSEAPPGALEFYREQALRADGPILEPMCGSGRYLLPLLAEGLDIEGSDRSAWMLEACSRRASALKLTPKLHEQSIEDLSPERRCALVFIPSGSFCLLTRAEHVRRALERVYAALLPGGKFVVEIERTQDKPPATTGTWGGRWLDLPDGSKLILSWLTEYSGVEQITRSIQRYEHVQGGRLLATEYEELAVRSYDPQEFSQALQSSGFANIQLLKPYTEEPIDDADEAVIFRCQRPLAP
jgi:SAM-dependent methyltransferase